MVAEDKKNTREQTKVSKGKRSYGDYDWIDLHRSGKLGSYITLN